LFANARTFFNNDISKSLLIRVHFPFILLALLLGSMHTWAAITNHSMNADGISYLDIGDAYYRGDWETAINPVWPPLYAWLLGGVNFLFRPSMQWEFPSVHLLNFIIYIGTLFSFIFLWANLRSPRRLEQHDHLLELPEWLWWASGYSLFLWISLSLIQMWAVTPDMLMAALLFLAAGLIARIRTAPRGWRLYAILGLVIGLGYLAKTFMFSIAFLLIVMSLLVTKIRWSNILKSALAFFIFMLVSLPFIYMISVKAGKPTIGEAGTVTFLRYVGGIPFPHWQGDPEKGNFPSHPSRILLDDPPVYEFGEPIGGTYPISTDPSYWYQGISASINLENQLYRVIAGITHYLELLTQRQGIFFACILVLLVIGIIQKAYARPVLKDWVLTLTATAALGLYALVLVEDRYVGSFILLFWTDLLRNIRLPNHQNNRTLMRVSGSLAVLGLLMSVFLFNLEGISRLNPDRTSRLPQQWLEIHRPVGRVKLPSNCSSLASNRAIRVGVIGYAYDSFWARLARVKIVAELLETDANEFWVGDEALQADVVDAFARSGAKAVVAEYVPGYANLEGWHQVGISNYYIFTFIEP
jgi:4-amino-4-deoxy-L-arabinose transferase-like glycosyltransferase